MDLFGVQGNRVRRLSVARRAQVCVLAEDPGEVALIRESGVQRNVDDLELGCPKQRFRTFYPQIIEVVGKR